MLELLRCGTCNGFWPNSKSRMYLLENTGEFVKANGLQQGDFIVIYSDNKWQIQLVEDHKTTVAANDENPIRLVTEVANAATQGDNILQKSESLVEKKSEPNKEEKLSVSDNASKKRGEVWWGLDLWVSNTPLQLCSQL